MTEEQVAEILREVFGYLRRLNLINDSQWRNEVESRIRSTAERVAGMSKRPAA
jgi:hypothetical protein